VKGVAILGATGSIGRSTFAVLEAHPDAYRVVSIAARSDVARMVELCLHHRPEVAVMEQSDAAGELERRLRKAGAGTRVAAGAAAIEELARDGAAQVVMAAISGAASVTTKSTHEAFGIPTPQANAEGLRVTRMAIYLARQAPCCWPRPAPAGPR